MLDIWGKVEKTDYCWNWKGEKNRDGYGLVFFKEMEGKHKRKRAHRVIFELLEGTTLKGKQLDHLCRNRACVKPEHLEVVDSRTNTLRGVGPSAINAKRVNCKNGHPFTEENTYNRLKESGRPYRQCKACVFQRIAEKKRCRENPHTTTCSK